MPTDEEIEEYIKRCNDKTGVLRRYWEYLKRQPRWEVFHAK